jgi:hypothetical protein
LSGTNFNRILISYISIDFGRLRSIQIDINNLVTQIAVNTEVTMPIPNVMANPLTGPEPNTSKITAAINVIDANITTLIAAVILLVFGSGPVKGFAITLGIGIVTSVFTAIWVTRLLISIWIERKRPKSIEI